MQSRLFCMKKEHLNPFYGTRDVDNGRWEGGKTKSRQLSTIIDFYK